MKTNELPYVDVWFEGRHEEHRALYGVMRSGEIVTVTGDEDHDPEEMFAFVTLFRGQQHLVAYNAFTGRRPLKH